MYAVAIRWNRGASRRGRPVIVVPKRIAKTAVARNRLRRRLRAILAREAATADSSCVVVARPEALLLSFEDLVRETLRALRSAR